MKSNLKFVILSISFAASLTGCGVRGRPQPPLTPPELGRGQPSFKRATEEFAFPEVPSPTPVPDSKSQQENR
jgi:predicted small lipoprotein YifL